MDETALSDKWDALISSHFQDLEREGKVMVTQDDETDEALLAELDWFVSEAKFKELVAGDITVLTVSFHTPRVARGGTQGHSVANIVWLVWLRHWKSGDMSHRDVNLHIKVRRTNDPLNRNKCLRHQVEW